MKKMISSVGAVALPMLIQLCFAQGGDSVSKVAHPLGAIPTNLPPEKLYRQFIGPGPAFRGKPLWSWNGRLEQDELIRQIHVMKEMGFGYHIIDKLPELFLQKDGRKVSQVKWHYMKLTRRNTFGPLHLVPMKSGAYGPGHWITGGRAFANDYQLWRSGQQAC